MSTEVRGPLVTTSSLARDLAALGIGPGSTVLVHASLSALGWVCGGAPALLTAFERVLGPDGTVAVPTFTPDLSDPAGWQRPPIPREWWAQVRAEMPPFDPDRTPSRGMGAFAELVRVQPQARRSSHPQTSMAALGRHADRITATHPLTPRLGLGTPLAQLRDLDATVLFVGVGFARNTAFHLAEYETDYPGRSWGPRLVPVAGPDGRVDWQQCTDLRFHEADFEPMGQAFLAGARSARTGAIGAALATAFAMAELVESAGRWLAAHRDLRDAG